jgi:biotin carboxyl carrier protein
MRRRWRYGDQEIETAAKPRADDPGLYEVTVGENTMRLRAHRRADGGLTLTTDDGRRSCVVVTRDGDRRWVSTTDGTFMVETSHRGGARAFAPGALEAPMPGKVVQVLVQKGDEVPAGARLLVVEAMKMEHALIAPHAGVVTHVQAEVGAMVRPGVALVSIKATGP